MNQRNSHKPPLSSVLALIGAALFVTAARAFAAPIEPGGHPVGAGDAVATEQAAGHHGHALPSMFRKGDVYIKVSVNGHPAAWMDLDTGTTDSLIDSEYANAIGLKLTPKSEAIEGFGSMKTPTFSTDALRLQVGIEPEKTVFFESIRLNGMVGPDGVQLAGLLGHSFLDKHVIVIDYKSQQVYFDDMAQQADPRDVAMALVEGVPSIKLTMANQAVNALIDTGGSYGVIITPATAKALGTEALMADAKPVGTVGHGGNQHIVLGKAPPFSIGDLAVRDVSAAYTTFGTATTTLGVGVSLGTVFLKNYKLTLNYPANTARFEP